MSFFGRQLEYIRRIVKYGVAIAALTSCFAAVCRTASPAAVPENLVACSKLPDPGERVRCYDTQIAAMIAQGAHTAAPAATAPKQPSNATFGEELLPLTSRSKAPARAESALLSSITAVSQIGPKLFVISLANGQVWSQEGSQITTFFHVGDDARIERGALGSYHLSTTAAGQKNWVLVTRIQ
jgi:hypothetical protein